LLKNSKIHSVVFVGSGLVFLAGIIYLLVLRFGQGDVYPAYSSLRRDPLGSYALHDSLAGLPNRDVHRNYLPLERLPITKGTTVLYLGARPILGDQIHKDVLKKFDRITDSGGRLVLAFYPENQTGQRSPDGSPCKTEDSTDCESKQTRRDEKPESDIQAPDGTAGDRQSNKQDSSDNKNSDDHFTSIRDHWGLSFELMGQAEINKDTPFIGEAITDVGSLPEAISWHSLLFFKEPEPSWNVLYTVNDLPVVVERQFGNGSILFLSDTYLFSNEALRADRHPQLLAYAVGPSSTFVFDESHFGISRRQGVADLVRLYRFHWFVLVVVLMAALYVWKNTVKFIPPAQGSGETGVRSKSAERDYTQGLIGMLRRYIPKHKILPVCLQEFIETDRFGFRIPREKTDRIRSIADTLSQKNQEKKNPVRVYQSISRMLKRKSI
jgi:hypothetical protein